MKQVKDMSFSITARTLKWIAMITKLIDHIGAALIEVGILQQGDAITEIPHGEAWLLFDTILRMIGRLSFPIFAFLLVEGFQHTHNRTRYALQLGVFALISEIPYDLAFQEVAYQNIYFTLCLGVCMMMACERWKTKQIYVYLCVLITAWFAWLIACDYDAIGILLIYLFYRFYKQPTMRDLTTGICMLCYVPAFLFTAVLSLIPIRAYHGVQGSTKHKYFFYCFYPIHLVLLWLIRIVFITPLF